MTVTNPRIAVVMINWNNHQDTRICLEALEKSKKPVVPIVFDNASTQKGIEEVCAEFPNTVLLRSHKNNGFGQGNNIGLEWGLENTEADYFFILNNDAFVRSDTISKLASHLDNNSDVGCVSPQILFAEPPHRVWYGGGEIDWCRGSGRVWNRCSARDESRSAASVGFVSGCAMMVRREALSEIGGFDPRYFMYEEDVDFSLRLSKAGYRIDYLSRAIVFHRVQGSNREAGKPFYGLKSAKNPRLAFFVYHLVANRLLTMHKHAEGAKRVQFAVCFSLYLFSLIVRYAIRGRSDAVVAMFKGSLRYLKIRNTTYTDMLTGKEVE